MDKRSAAPLILTLIILLYLLLATAYSVVVPIGRGADEWAHYWYAEFIAQNGRLPASPAERDTAGYKSDWPPLYHVLAAALTAGIDTAGPPTFKYRADSVRRQVVPAVGPEAIIHTEDERFPWRQEILVWHLGRFLSILFSAATVLVTFRIALEVFQGSRGVGKQGNDLPPATCHPLPIIRNSQLLALVATAALAFNPRFLFTGMLFNYDSLTLLLSSLFLWLTLRVAKGKHPRWGFWGLGTLAGLALVTKYLAAPLLLVIVLVAAIRAAGESGSGGASDATRNTQHATHITFYVLRASKFWKYLGQAAVTFLLASGWWFVYLIINFNEVETYGPLLGVLAPLIRGDGSDRTVEALFAWLSGGQAPAPAHIEQQSHSAGQIIASFFNTFWGNPIVQPYPLVWFTAAMALVSLLAFAGLILHFRFSVSDSQKSDSSFIIRHSSFVILLLTVLLPVPFMAVRLFGARDALEAVQGRHILFLTGPAVAVLLVLGLSVVIHHLSFAKLHNRHSPFAIRHSIYVLPFFLLSGAIAQFVFMSNSYPPPAPVQTTPYRPTIADAPPPDVTLPGGATLLTYHLTQLDHALQITLVWQAGDDFAPEDYTVEYRLLGNAGAARGWSGVQTQARYPTRVWEPDDVVRDTGWLILDNLAAGDYQLEWRILGQNGPIIEWRSLAPFTLYQMTGLSAAEVTVWRNGQPAEQSPPFTERQTAQFTIHNSQLTIDNLRLTGPDGVPHPPASAGPGWANFIVQPNWPAGDYRLEGTDGGPVLRVAASGRNFEIPGEMAAPLQANFAGQIGLLGYTLPQRRVTPGGGLPVTLYWQGLDWMSEDFVIFTRLLDNQGLARGGYDRLAREDYSTLRWAPGEVVTDGFAVPVDSAAPDGVYTLSVGWYRRNNGQAESLPLVDPQTGQPTGQTAVAIGTVKVGGPPPGVTITESDAAPQTARNVTLGEQINLLGFDGPITNEQLSMNNEQSSNSPNSINLTLYWQALRPPDADYTVFVHLRDTDGSLVAQKDQPPAGGAYPTGLWDAGEIIRDDISLPLDGVPPGRYQLVAGLYNFATGQRLPVPGVPDGAVLLQNFTVEGQGVPE